MTGKRYTILKNDCTGFSRTGHSVKAQVQKCGDIASLFSNRTKRLATHMKETMTTGEAPTKQWLLKKGIKRKTNDEADDEGSQTYSKFTTKRPRLLVAIC